MQLFHEENPKKRYEGEVYRFEKAHSGKQYNIYIIIMLACHPTMCTNCLKKRLVPPSINNTIIITLAINTIITFNTININTTINYTAINNMILTLYITSYYYNTTIIKLYRYTTGTIYVRTYVRELRHRQAMTACFCLCCIAAITHPPYWYTRQMIRTTE